MTYEEYLCAPDIDEHTEWVDGEVIPMMSVSDAHARLTAYLVRLLGNYLEDRGLGEVFTEPFNMKLEPDLPGRSPDVLVVLTPNRGRVEAQFLNGPADLVIEIISPGTESVDRGAQFLEYEAGGVPEYWILDPHRENAEFLVRNDKGRLHAASLGPDGRYRSSAIPGLVVDVEWFWNRPPLRQIASQLEQHR
jgi:Uma2 family endonuclease